MAEQPMSAERRRLLESAMERWMCSLQLDDVLPYLRAQSVFPEHVIDSLLSERSQRARLFQFIRHLQRRGNNAYVQFYRSLLQSKQRHLASLLEAQLSPDEILQLSERPMKRLSWECVQNEIEHRLLPIEKIESQLLPEAVEKNELYYKDFRCLIAKEPRGILDDLHVESVDNRNGDAIIFDKFSMYRNFSSPRGLALIINNRFFSTMPERLGTEIDEANLKNLFSQLEYRVVQHKNLTAKEMHLAVRQFGQRVEHARADSCVVCVLTHGEDGQLLGVDEESVPVADFVALLNSSNCPVLAQKPKLFFLQACRGDRRDSGFDVFGGAGDRADGFLNTLFRRRSSHDRSIAESDSKLKLPVEADILIAYATTPGYVSWRNSLRGTWFVQSICEVFAKHASRIDVLSMLTMVNKRVAEAYESSPGAFKQIPDVSSRLRLSFYFFPGMSMPNGDLL